MTNSRSHPAADESELGWLRIAVTLGPLKFSTAVGHAGGGDNKGNVTTIKSVTKGKKFGATLHQQVSGHGYTPKAQTNWRVQENAEHDNSNSTSLLGASPFEYGQEHLGIGRFYKRFGKE